MKMTDDGDKIEKIKNGITGVVGAIATGAGVATGNPFLVAGGISSILQSILSSTISGRSNQWYNELSEDFKKLEDKVDGFNFEEKINDPRVASAIIETTLSAIKTDRDEKKQMLRNAVLNISTTSSDNLDKELIFLRLIDEFTPSHVKVLQILAEPEQHVIQIIEQDPNKTGFEVPNNFISITELGQEMYDLILNDLRAKGLLATQETRYLAVYPNRASSAPSSGPIEEHYSGSGGEAIPISFTDIHDLPENVQQFSSSIRNITVESKNYVSSLGYEFLNMIKNPLTDE